MKLSIITFLLLLSFSDVSFAFAKHPGKEKQERISQGVYGTRDALRVSRVDVAETIINETARITTPPRKPLDIKALSKTTTDKSGVKTITKYVVLPAKMNGQVIKKDSPEFQELLQDRELLKVYQEGEKKWQKYSEKVSDTLRLLDKEKNDLRDANVKLEKENAKLKAFKSFVTRIVVGFILGIVALVVIWVFIKVLGITARAAF